MTIFSNLLRYLHKLINRCSHELESKFVKKNGIMVLIYKCRVCNKEMDSISFNKRG